MWPIEKLTHYRETARLMEPHHEVELGRLRRSAKRAESVAVLALLDVNDWLIARFQPDTPALWDKSAWPWIVDVEGAVDDIRVELQSYLGGGAFPHVAEVAGYDPDSEGGRASVPVDTGAWRSVILFSNGAWIDETARHFPVTRSCFESLHPKSNVGFSALEGHSHIAAHVGSNRGALRLQVPIIVPGTPGDCRIRIEDNTVNWSEGDAIVFDLKCDHEAWNDCDDIRVLLMVEIPQPLPTPLSWINRATQHSLRWHPSYRKLPERIARFGRDHDVAAAQADSTASSSPSTS